MLRACPWPDRDHHLKRQRIETPSVPDQKKCVEEFLTNLVYGFSYGVQGYDDLNQPSALESFISTSTLIFGVLHNHCNNEQDGSVIISLRGTTLIIYENEEGVELVMDGVTKVLEGETIFTLNETLISDIASFPEQYGNELSVYVENINNYGDSFNIYNKSISTSSFNKNQIYIPMENTRAIQDLNGNAQFDSSDKDIVCRHLATQFVKDSLQNKNGKVDFTKHYSSEESIAAHISTKIETEYEVLKANAKRNDLIRNDDLGKQIISYFEDMQSTEKKEAVRVLLIESTNHTMAIRLSIKGTVDKPIYVIRFYDPGKTNTAVRCEVDDLSILENHTLKYYIDGTASEESNYYQYYYDEAEPISMVIECDLANLEIKTVNNEKRLSSYSSDPLTPTHIYYLLSENLFSDFAQLKNQLQEIGKRSPEELAILLAAKGKNGIPGFHLVLKYGYKEVIKIFGELLQLLPENFRAELLSAKDEDGTPGFFVALQKNQVEIIKIFGELLKLINDQDVRAELIAAKCKNGTSALFMIMQKGYGEAVRAYGELLNLITDENVRAELLAAKCDNGISGLYAAALFENVKVINAYGELLRLINDENIRAELIAAKNSDDTPAIAIGMLKEKKEVVDALTELFDLIKDTDKCVKLIADLLT